MSGPRRILVAIAAACIVLVLAAGVAADVYLRHAGMVVIQVEEERGDRVNIRMPAALLEITSWFIPHCLVGQASLRSGPWSPAVLPALDQLDEMPDCVLVDVSGPGEKVRIETKHGRLLLRVLSPGEKVNISIPIRSASRILRRIEQAARADGAPQAVGAGTPLGRAISIAS
jgi:hypothetical protein